MSLEHMLAFYGSLATAEDNRDMFQDAVKVGIARAPGRLDLMGGIADYSGSLVLQWPLLEAAMAAAGPVPERKLRILSRQGPRRFEMPLEDFEWHGKPISYELAREYFQRDPARHWAAYAAGAFLALMRERGVRFQQGASILIDSEVPEGKGVSSSAALEVAVMQAVAAVFEIRIKPRDVALLCQKVENLVAGAPCGVMDQMTAVLGESGCLLSLLCQPAQVCGTIELPKGMEIWGIDSGLRHAVSGADYISVRVGAFMGHKIISEMRGGLDYLANLAPSEFERLYAAQLPERMSGADFLEEYGRTADPVTRVEADREYAVRVPAAHPVYENFRVRLFERLLLGRGRREETGEVLSLLGELMYQSHESYSACGLGSEGTDRLVALVREAGPKSGLYGAKITGGGSGGTVAVLGRNGARQAVEAVARQYGRETGYEPQIFFESSAGAAVFPPVVRSLKEG